MPSWCVCVCVLVVWHDHFFFFRTITTMNFVCFPFLLCSFSLFPYHFSLRFWSECFHWKISSCSYTCMLYSSETMLLTAIWKAILDGKFIYLFLRFVSFFRSFFFSWASFSLIQPHFIYLRNFVNDRDKIEKRSQFMAIMNKYYINIWSTWAPQMMRKAITEQDKIKKDTNKLWIFHWPLTIWLCCDGFCISIYFIQYSQNMHWCQFNRIKSKVCWETQKRKIKSKTTIL